MLIFISATFYTVPATFGNSCIQYLYKRRNCFIVNTVYLKFVAFRVEIHRCVHLRLNYLSNHVASESTKYLNPANFVYLQYSLEYFISVRVKRDLDRVVRVSNSQSSGTSNSFLHLGLSSYQTFILLSSLQLILEKLPDHG